MSYMYQVSRKVYISKKFVSDKKRGKKKGCMQHDKKCDWKFVCKENQFPAYGSSKIRYHYWRDYTLKSKGNSYLEGRTPRADAKVCRVSESRDVFIFNDPHAPKTSNKKKS